MIDEGTLFWQTHNTTIKTLYVQLLVNDIKNEEGTYRDGTSCVDVLAPRTQLGFWG
jgi:hypothetical protein